MIRLSFRKLTMVLALLSVCAMAGMAFPQKPVPERLVNDLAGIFSSSQVSELERMLVAFDDSTSNQIVVVTVKDLEGDAPASYAYRIGEQWGVGGEAFNNGVVVLVRPKTALAPGEVSIQVGYGLEGAIPDVYCKRIIDGSMIPFFRDGDMYGGVKTACEDLMGLANGEISQPRDYSDAEEDLVEILFRLLLFFLVMYILIRIFNRKGGRGGGWGSGSDFGRHVYIGPIDGWDWGSTGRGGTGTFGGGGFGGGFGGFGGGHFGGGGASGSW